MSSIRLPIPSTQLSPRDLLLATAVVGVWGTNFVVVRIGLNHLPPLLFAALRFLLASLPVLFVRFPAVSWRKVAAYGWFIGVGQFGLVFIAMNGHISPGLASIVIQVQVFVTIGLSVRLAGERVAPYQWAAMLLAATGIAVIAAHASATTTPLGIALVLLAAVSWAAGNLVSKSAGRIDMFAFVVWSSLFAFPPLFLLSFVFEGWPAIRLGLHIADAPTWAALVWQTVGNTLFGYVAWSRLLARYPAATVAPMSLLVPIFGIAASAWWLAEPLPGWKLAAAGLVIGGLAIGVLYPRWRSAHALVPPPPL